MPINLTCECGAKYRVGDHLAGRKTRCKMCSSVLQIPAAEPEILDGEGLLEPLENDRGAYDVAGDDDNYSSRRPVAAAEPPDLPRGGPVTPGQTFASNPGRTRIQWSRWLVCFPWIPAAALLGSVAVGIAALLIKPIVFAGAGVIVFFLFVHLNTQRQKFLAGDVNPGVVVSDSPYLVAVLFDMAKGRGTRPAVKVVRQPLGRMTGGPAKVGDRLATVSLYGGDVGGGDAWGDAYPTVINCATANETDVARVQRSISRADWARLDAAVARLPTPQTPGLYTLWDGNAAGRKQRWSRFETPAIWVVAIIAVGLLAKYGTRNKGKSGSPDPAPEQVAQKVDPAPAPAVDPIPKVEVPTKLESPRTDTRTTRPFGGVPAGPQTPPQNPIRTPYPTPPTTTKPPAITETPKAPGTADDRAAYAAAVRKGVANRQEARSLATGAPNRTGTTTRTAEELDKEYAELKAQVEALEPKIDQTSLDGATRSDAMQFRSLAAHVENIRSSRERMANRRTGGGGASAGGPAAGGRVAPGDNKPRPLPADVKVGDKIEALDKTVWRTATILKRDGDRLYLHWDGWSDAWDEWVGPDRVRPVTPK
jgi:hypothetical protein